MNLVKKEFIGLEKGYTVDYVRDYYPDYPRPVSFKEEDQSDAANVQMKIWGRQTLEFKNDGKCKLAKR